MGQQYGALRSFRTRGILVTEIRHPREKAVSAMQQIPLRMAVRPAWPPTAGHGTGSGLLWTWRRV
jgi:hypothetical protein